MIDATMKIILCFLLAVGLFSFLEDRRLNRKATELLDRVKLLALIAHFECKLPDEEDTSKFKVNSLESLLRDLEVCLLNHTHREKDKSDNQKQSLE